MRKFEFITPQIEINEVNDRYGMFTITPLERGYGLTIGNALRRVLISSMPGVAIVAMQIEGVQNEFQAIPGVKEDVTEIVLNLKNIKLTIDEEKLNNGDIESIKASFTKQTPQMATYPSNLL